MESEESTRCPPAGRGRSVTPLAVFLLGILSLALLGWATRITELERRKFAVVDALMDAQIHAASFHLWLEEQLTEAPAEHTEAVWRHIDSATALGEALLKGGKSERGLDLPPVGEAAHRHRLQAIHGALLSLRALAAERLEAGSSAGTGSALDDRFDAEFRAFQDEARALERVLEEELIRRQAWRRRLTVAVFVVWSVIIGAATAGQLHHQRRQCRAEAKLWDARRALQAANEELESRVRRRTESLREANEELTREVAERRSAQNALFEHQERLRALSSELTLAEQRERRRIAAELHDHVGTALAFAKMQLAGEADPACASSTAAQEAVRVIDRVIDETRSLTFQLSPPALYELGLGAALERLVGRFGEDHGLAARFEDGGFPSPVPEDLTVLLYQAVRELLVNVVKHARARSVRVTCTRDGEELRITVEDDGIGFSSDYRTSGNRHAFGLFSVGERLGSLGGALEIESGPSGSRVTLLAPLIDRTEARAS